MQKIWVHLLGWEDSLEKRAATHSSILAWRIPWTVLFMGSQRVGHYWVISLHFYIKNVRVRSLIMAGFLCYVDGLPEYQPIREAGAAAAKSLQSCPTLWDPTDPTEPTRLPRPWDSPGKNTGVGCHRLLQCMKVKSKSEVIQSCPTLSDPMDCSLPGSSVHGIFPGKNTGVGCHCLLR